MKKLTYKQKKIISCSIAIWGIILVGASTSMMMIEKPKVENKNNMKIIKKRISEIKSNEIKLKDIELEINQPLSVDIKDYLVNINDIETKIIKELKLDTSMVNTSQAASYTYTISYKNKKFNGIIKIKEKKLPDTQLTLKSLNLQTGSTLSTDIQTYINEQLSDEIKANAKIDLSNINTAQSGNYQYSVTYNGKLYTGNITIYEPQIEKKPTSTSSNTPTVENNSTKEQEPQQ